MVICQLRHMLNKKMAPLKQGGLWRDWRGVHISLRAFRALALSETFLLVLSRTNQRSQTTRCDEYFISVVNDTVVRISDIDGIRIFVNPNQFIGPNLPVYFFDVTAIYG